MRIVSIALSAWWTFLFFISLSVQNAVTLWSALLAAATVLSVLGTVARYKDRDKLSAILFVAVAVDLYSAFPFDASWAIVSLVVAVVCFFAPMKGPTGVAKMGI